MLRRLLVVLFLVAWASIGLPKAQMRVAPLDEDQGHVALGLALRHLGNAGIFLMATAHPDDENNGLLVMLNRGQGFRTVLATATRGNGGQNEIGPEIFEALGVLRTEELAALHRFDGAEQYFTRAVDFGFSFSLEETFEKWGRDQIVADFVRLIRATRPDVMTALTPTGNGGGQHHQASAILAREAFNAAGDPARFPEQIAAGLRPWQPKKFYFARGGGAREAAAGTDLTIPLSTYDRLLGKTYSEIGTEARSMHKCQGMAQLLSLPGPASATYQLVESSISGSAPRQDASLFDGVDTSILGLGRYGGPAPPKGLTDGLAMVAASVADAQRRFDIEGDEATLDPLLAGLQAVRTLRGALEALSISDVDRYDLDFRLRQKEQEFQQAILIAGGVRIEALADDGVVTPGQPVRVSFLLANRGSRDVVVKHVRFNGFEGDTSCALTPVVASSGGPGAGRGATGAQTTVPISVVSHDVVGQCAPSARIPANARVSEPYWHRAGEAGRYTFDDDAPFGVPHRPTPFAVDVSISIAGSDVVSTTPVQYRYEGDIFSGEKRADLLVVPPVSVSVSPPIAIIPAATRATVAPASQRREMRVTVVNDTPGTAESVVRLEVPQGWSTVPAQQAATFSREGEARTVRFQVQAPSSTPRGQFPIRAVVSSRGAEFARGYQVIEYPHIRRQHILRSSEATLKVVDVKVAGNLTVGYVMGVGDEVPAAIEQLGVAVEAIGPDDLAFGDLSRFSTIVTGVRAYERRVDLRANNRRLLDYVREGGTLVVQYNKFEFNEAQYGPYPAKVSSERATDEFAPVTLLQPDSPLLNSPNVITDETWKGWVQERGLYFLGERDPRYRDLVSVNESFQNNRGEKRGALVMADYGKGRWVYVGLGLWRELPAGVEGAYQLLANLVSLGH